MLRIGYICDTGSIQDNGAIETDGACPQSGHDRAALIEAGCTAIRMETSRPPRAAHGAVLQAIMDFAAEGDEIVTLQLNHIAASSSAILAILKTLHGRGVSLRVLEPGLCNSGIVDESFIKTLELICSLDQRAPSRPLGVLQRGRGHRVTKDDICSLQARGMTTAQIAQDLGVSRMTIWRKQKQA